MAFSQPSLQVTELNYQDWHDTVAIFTPFAAEPWALLLDSAAANHPNSRYDMLLRQPCKTFTWPNAQTQRNPFQQLQDELTRSPIAPLPAPYQDLPFQGGLVGLFGYDLGRTLEVLPELAQQDIDLPDLAVGFYHHALIIDHQEKRTYALQPADFTVAADEFWQSNSKANNSAFQLTSAWHSNLSATEYHRRIDQIHEYLRAGDCYQINLAQRFQATFQGDPWQAYIALRNANRAPFSAWLNLPQGCVLSLSPERFLRVAPDGHVETKPIKGTLPRLNDPNRDAEQVQRLKDSRKDQAENLMIVDLLRNDLSRVCQPGSVQVSSLFAIESFNAVHHLVSTVEGRLPADVQPLALLAAAFPGGSITGAPKIRAMEIIDSLEPHRRSVYCGSIGYFSVHGQSDTSITIRTLCTYQDSIYCWAGGGIVHDSDAASEYQETFDKVAKILPVLQTCGDVVNTVTVDESKG
ncbi:MAG: aminodeoxychorismate synthase component I [Aliidiomarina sp.]|uniref:aminodeoxychorismate synthase component I n=1 Tax=Aliidiomarina sp. TaxID=1872439 RepID=UPI0025C24021|nr:aminodeoxychorismate synthase component I [Aliidiomarina sp.]MCH8500578.1 aminodeoxychorismate synthase component I [Aliidiomarina sp.]